MQNLLNQVRNKQIDFNQIIDFIDSHYTFTATEFTNGEQTNVIGTNEKSAKVFAFAKLNQLNKEDTLLLFAEHYQNVLATPDEDNHHNIRNFMQYGWERLVIADNVLQEK